MSNFQRIEHCKTYSEMCLFESFEDRFNYLKLHGQVGIDTFGFDRYMNQNFYRSKEWRHIRSYVITRDNGCELGSIDHPIFGRIYIHHINPIYPEDIVNGSRKLLDPENLVCVSMEMHNALHYGDNSILNKNKLVERSPNDTQPWKQ